MPVFGKCHCGATSYRLDVSALNDAAICHCTACRKSTGGTHVTWATVAKNKFEWTGQRPQTYTSSEHGTRYFCKTCGAQLAFFTTKTPDHIDITITTTDDPEHHQPTRHIWVKSKLPWVKLNDNLKLEAGESTNAN